MFAAVLTLLFRGLALDTEGVPRDEPPTPTARIELRADADCATRTELVARVQSRSRRIQFVEEGEGVRIRASVSPSRAQGFVGELTITREGESPTVRRLATRSCAEAVDGLGLIIAVMLDPLHVSLRGDDTSTAPQSPSSSEPSTPAPPAAPGRDIVAEKPAPPQAPVWWYGAHVMGQVLLGPTPSSLPGISASAFVGLRRGSLFSPMFLLGAVHGASVDQVSPGGTATFTLDAAVADACPMGLVSTSLSLHACASALAGRMRAEGSKTFSAASESRPFFALGGAALARARLWSWLELHARAGAGWTNPRDRYAFSPTVFHRASAVTASFGVGLGAAF